MLRRILLVLAILVVGAITALLWFFSGDGVRRALEEQATAWLGQSVRIGRATAQIFPRVAIQLGDVRIGEPVRLTLADVEVSTGLRALISRRVEDAEIIISDSRLDLPLPFSIPTSSSSTSPASTSTGIEVVSVRAITLRNVRVVSRKREIVVSAQSSLAGTHLNLVDFRARAGDTELQASGTVDLEPTLDAKLTASANELDLDDLLALAGAFSPTPTPAAQKRRSGALVSGRIAAKLKADRGRAAGVDLRNLSSSMLVQGDHVTLSPVSFELFGGKYEGALRANVGNNMAISLNSRITNLDVAKLAAFGGVSDTITGTLSGSGRFSGSGRDMAAALASASGDGEATILDGTIKRLELVRTIVLFFGRPAADAPQSSGERFNRIATSFTLARQVIRTDSLAMQSPDVDIAASGTLTIPTKALDGRADLMLSESLSAQAGTDLVRYTREGNRVVLPSTIGGTLEQPRVMIDAAAAVKRGIRNEIERKLKGIIDRLKPPPQ